MSARRGLLIFFILFGVAAAGALFIGMRGGRSMQAVASSNLLVFDVPYELEEGQPPPSTLSFSIVQPRRMTVWSVVEGLRHAANDDRISGLVLHIDNLGWGWAKLQEVRDAVLEFRRAGKPVYASVTGGGEAEYFLASAAGTLASPPLASVQLDGLRVSALFMRGTLDKLDIHPNFVHMGQYKSAVEQYTNTGLSGPAREALEQMVDETYRWMLDSLATARGLEPDSMPGLIDRGPFRGAEAVALGLVDTLMYRSDLDSMATGLGSKRLPTVSFNRYVDWHAQSPGAPRIAMIVASGVIVPGRSHQSPGSGEMLGSETLVKALRQASERSAVKAVVLRIDSPGGSAPASDDIWRAVRHCASRKPVIASLSDYAASGGYYIAVAAESIVAQPATVTGSIGVYGGKLNLLGLYRKLGFNVETITRGRNAEMLSPYSDFSPEEAERFEAGLNETYVTFKDRVATGRSLDTARVETVAQGRVWTGLAARERGLVDALGGIDRALQIAKQRAGLDEDETVVVEIYPKDERTFAQRFFSDVFGSDEDDEDAAARIPDALKAWFAMAEFSRADVLAMLPFTLDVR